MIEQVFFFTLGVLSAGLICLMLLPALWSRATRVTSEHLAERLPISLSEVHAQRDLLRAQHAVHVVQLEQAVETLRDQLAQARAAQGRHFAERLALKDHVATLERELAHLRADMVAAQAELGAAHLMLDHEKV